MISFVGSDIAETCLGFPAGQPFDGGGGAGAAAFRMAAVGTDVAVLVPAEFLAVTWNLSVLPTSAETGV
jgi:hypothetical protein